MKEDAEELHRKLYPEASAKKEYIICAAVHYDDGIVHWHQPINISTGIVLCGRRHHNVISNYSQLTGLKSKCEDVQGFLTSKDRFVNREEGGAIAFEAGQITKSTNCLFSEDLY